VQAFPPLFVWIIHPKDDKIKLLGITGLKARDVIGYATAVMILSFLVFAIPLLFLPV
jgi:short subunit fatty acids transporter